MYVVHAFLFAAYRYVTDALPAILVSTLLFICPAERPDWMCFRGVTVKTVFQFIIESRIRKSV